MIKNKTKNKILAKDFKICSSLFSKFKGLMFAKKHKTLIFDSNKEKNISLHMFFVFYPIDVLWLDKDKKITHIKQNFIPFTVTKSYKAKYVIELEKGTLEKTNTSIGDIVSFK